MRWATLARMNNIESKFLISRILSSKARTGWRSFGARTLLAGHHFKSRPASFKKPTRRRRKKFGRFSSSTKDFDRLAAQSSFVSLTEPLKDKNALDWTNWSWPTFHGNCNWCSDHFTDAPIYLLWQLNLHQLFFHPYKFYISIFCFLFRWWCDKTLQKLNIFLSLPFSRSRVRVKVKYFCVLSTKI